MRPSAAENLRRAGVGRENIDGRAPPAIVLAGQRAEADFASDQPGRQPRAGFRARFRPPAARIGNVEPGEPRRPPVGKRDVAALGDRRHERALVAGGRARRKRRGGQQEGGGGQRGGPPRLHRAGDDSRRLGGRRFPGRGALDDGGVVMMLSMDNRPARGFPVRPS